MNKRNVLVIMSDEHQARAMGCAGHPFVKTPNLDRLAERGMRFTNGYTPSPICIPARASFATGLYAHQTRMWDNAMPYDGSIRGWGHALQEKGVAVESIGKLHYRSDQDPNGFDVEHIPMMVAGAGMVWASIRKEDERIPGRRRMLGDYIGPGTSNYTEYDEAVTAQTRDWLAARSQSDDPWCLYIGLVAPHFPLVVPQEFYDMYPPDMVADTKLHPDDGYVRHPWVERQNAINNTESKFKDADERIAALRAYYGLCSFLDHNIGQILDAIDAAGFTDDTTVIYTSDHGDNLGARGLWGKSNLYEESVAVPMIMAGPLVPSGICETPVSLLDISATIAKNFDADFTPAEGVTDLMSVVSEGDGDRVVFSEYHAVGSVSGAFMVRKGAWKLIHYVGFPDELFNLDIDPEELDNRANDPECAEVLADLHAELRAICDPLEADAQAFADQAELVARMGGRDVVLNAGSVGATPPPELKK